MKTARPVGGTMGQWLRWGLVLTAVTVVALSSREWSVYEWFVSGQQWAVEHPVWAAGLFVLAYMSTVLLLGPAWPFAVASGATFGLAGGFALSTMAANLTAMTAFLIARHLGRMPLQRWLERFTPWQAWEHIMARGGWRIVVLLRLSPVVPFNVQNYLYGLSNIGFWPCTLASLVAMVPGTLLYVYLGWLGQWTLSGTKPSTPLGMAGWLLAVAGLVATVVLTLYLTYLARQALTARTASLVQAGAHPCPETKAVHPSLPCRHRPLGTCSQDESLSTRSS
ncbi:MAG: TVP38/TMEM64 family protein [Gemmataceae bacterium]|nr:TVP38/TMEM64 family protein [Gemmataceae bacterium]MDW8242648.1 TVP38/TMEM64 family protein [Thermogemmata sp.]